MASVIGVTVPGDHTRVSVIPLLPCPGRGLTPSSLGFRVHGSCVCLSFLLCPDSSAPGLLASWSHP